MSCIRSYDALCEALEAYEAAPHPSEGWQRRFGQVALWSFRCGRPDGVATLPWAQQRVATYTNPVSFSIRRAA